MSLFPIDKSRECVYKAAVLAGVRMKDIYKLLAEKRRQLEALQKEVEALTLAAALLSGEGNKEAKPMQASSQPQMIVAILEASGKPLHVRQIADQMKKKFNKPVKKTNLGVLLYRYAQRAKHFYKVSGKPNTFGLIKWQAMSAEHRADMAVQ